MASSELQRRISQAQKAAGLEAQSGAGFLSQKDCQEDPRNAAGKDIDKDGKLGDISSTCVVTTPGDTIGAITAKAVGSDIDYLLSADDLGAYVSAIANAAINRLIVAGVSGLTGVPTRNAPPGGTIPPGPGNCSGLTGAALIACRRYDTGSSGSFTLTKQNLLIQIDQSLIPRQNADTSLAAASQKLQTYITDLQGFITILQSKSLATCPNRDTYINSMNAELAWASTTMQAILNDKTQNQNVITQLITAQTTVQGLQSADKDRLSDIITQLNGAGLLNETAATDFETQTSNQLTAITDRINLNKPTFQQNVASCP